MQLAFLGERDPNFPRWDNNVYTKNLMIRINVFLCMQDCAVVFILVVTVTIVRVLVCIVVWSP